MLIAAGDVDTGLLRQIVVLFGAGLIASLLLRRLKAPAIIGYLVAGMLIGPGSLQLITRADVSVLAELGLVLLLFSVGLELSPEPLMRLGRRPVVLTVAQVGVTGAITALTLLTFSDLRPFAVFVLSVAVSLSSTAIVLTLLADRGETGSPTGTIVTGVLLLQDVLVILLMLMLPVFAGAADKSLAAAGVQIVVTLVALVGGTFVLRLLTPYVVAIVARGGGREFLTLFAVLMACLGAFGAAQLGWSWALGSAIAGLLLGSTDLRHQLNAEITPFRDVFNALFFISIGMLVEPRIVQAHWLALLIAVVVILVGKTIVTAVAVRIAGWPLRLAIGVGLCLCTVSEFGYVLAAEAYRFKQVGEEALSLLVACAVGSMLIGGMLVPLATPISLAVSRRLGGAEAAGETESPDAEALSGHVVIVGFGLNGENLARVLKATNIPYSVVEMNRSLAQRAREVTARVIVGDAVREAILHHAGIGTARALVVSIHDDEATRRIVAQAHRLRPDMYILARTRSIPELERLYKLGAEQVIPEEFETSIEIFAHVLREFGVPDNVIVQQIAVVRAGGYAMLRGSPLERGARTDLMKLLELTATQTFYIDPRSPAAGQTIRQLNLRAMSGVTIIAVVRGGKPQTNPSPDVTLAGDDVLVLVGAHAQLEAAAQHLNPPLEAEDAN